MVTLLLIVMIAYWKKSRKKQVLVQKEIYFFADNDYRKIKEIPTFNCVQCKECLIESNGCCSSCNTLQQYRGEEHCYNHNHSHHHVQKQHYNSTNNIQGYLLLLFAPLIMGAVVYRIINYQKGK
jgi:hypothetical protein